MWISEAIPDQLKLSFALWSREAVAELVEQKLSISLPVRTLGHYLKRWGFTPQKPIRKAYEQRPEQVQKWLDTEFPAIATRAKAENARGALGDETGLRSDDVADRSYAPRRKTPVVLVPSRSENLSLISAVTQQGKVRRMVFDGVLNTQIFLRLLARLSRDAERKVFLILDNLRVHHARPVQEWLEQNREHIEVFFLPSYSSELNPDERLNADHK